MVASVQWSERRVCVVASVQWSEKRVYVVALMPV